MEDSFHQGIDRLDLRLLDILQRHGALCVRSVNSSVAVTVIKESTALPLGL